MVGALGYPECLLPRSSTDDGEQIGVPRRHVINHRCDIQGAPAAVFQTNNSAAEAYSYCIADKWGVDRPGRRSCLALTTALHVSFSVSPSILGGGRSLVENKELKWIHRE